MVLVVAVVLLWRRDGAPHIEAVEAEAQPSPVDDADAVAQAAPVTAPAPRRAPAAASVARRDEVDDACEATVADARAFADAEANAAGLSGVEDRYSAELENLPRRLLGSSDPDVLLTVFALDRPEARVRTDPAAQATLLEFGLRAADSDSALLKWHALRVCVEAEGYCPFGHLEQALLEALSDNAEAWALAAALRYRRGDVAGALAAMQNAAHAPTSISYWTETTAVMARVLVEQTSLPHEQADVTAVGYAAATLPPLAEVRMCQTEGVTSRAWAEACLGLGRLRAERNETTLVRTIAYTLQERALAALGDSRGAQEAAQAAALYRAEMNAAATSTFWMNALLASSSQRFHAHLSAVRDLGEIEAGRVFLRRELPLLLERAGLLDREGARECIARFFEAPAPAETTFRDYPVESYPLQVGDELMISVSGRTPVSTSLRISSDGTIALRRLPAIAAVGKTTGQLRTEIAALVSDASNPVPQVVVILMAPRSPEERRIEFDAALREAKEGDVR